MSVLKLLRLCLCYTSEIPLTETHASAANLAATAPAAASSQTAAAAAFAVLG